MAVLRYQQRLAEVRANSLNWSYRWYHVGAGKQTQVLCTSNTCSNLTPEPPLQLLHSLLLPNNFQSYLFLM